MINEPLPKAADLRKLAQRGGSFDATFAVKQLPRIAGAVFDQVGTIHAQLHLGIDEQRIRYLRGRIDCDTELLCQRCMQAMPTKIHADVNLGIVWDEIGAKQLEKSIDPLIVAEDELIDLNEIVEDELLLNMPFVSYHAPEECPGEQSYSFGSKETEAALEKAESEKENPFKVLEQLKRSD